MNNLTFDAENKEILNENDENFIFEIRIGIIDYEKEKVNKSLLYSGTNRIEAERIGNEAVNSGKYEIVDFNFNCEVIE